MIRAFVLLGVIAGTNALLAETPTPTLTPYPSYTPYPSLTPYPTLTPTPRPTSSPRPRMSRDPHDPAYTPSASPRPTVSPVPTLTPTPFPTSSPRARMSRDPHEPTTSPKPYANFFVTCEVDGRKFRLYQREGRVFVEGTYYSQGPCEIGTDSKKADQRFSCPIADDDDFKKITFALKTTAKDQCQSGKWEATLAGKKDKKIACEPYPG